MKYNLYVTNIDYRCMLSCAIKNAQFIAQFLIINFAL